MIGTMKVRHDENEVDKHNKAKKFGAPIVDHTKRAALGDLQNRGVVRPTAGKEAVQKDASDVKFQNALRTIKARVDTHWKKGPSVGANDNATTAVNNVAAAINMRNPLTRANSLRSRGTGSAVAVTAAAGVASATNNGSAAIGTRKPLTRSNSIRSGVTCSTTTATAQVTSNANAAQNNKVKTTLTTKMVETKVQQKHVATKTTKGSLPREDSNLSRKALTNLKASLSKENIVAVKSGAHTDKSNSTTITLKKEEQNTKVCGSQINTGNGNVKSIFNIDTQIRIVSVRTHSSKLLTEVEDIDADDADNLVLVSEYVNDIYKYLSVVETQQYIRKNHLEGQLEIYPKMRAVLIDWINEVHLQFHLAVETFQMTVGIIDRYLQEVKDTKRSLLQLVGVTALFIAAKYEELFPPAVVDFVYITDDTYTAKQILQMEMNIFKALDYNLSRPLPIHFLRRFSKAGKAEDCHHAMSKYFLELSLIEYEMAAYKPSEIAAASLFLSLHLLNKDSEEPSGFDNTLWTPSLEYYSTYTADHLRPISKRIAVIACNAPNAKLKAVYSKYQSSKFHKISTRSELYGKLMHSIIEDV